MNESNKLLLADFSLYLDMAAEEEGMSIEDFTDFLSKSLNKFLEERNEAI